MLVFNWFHQRRNDKVKEKVETEEKKEEERKNRAKVKSQQLKSEIIIYEFTKQKLIQGPFAGHRAKTGKEEKCRNWKNATNGSSRFSGDTYRYYWFSIQHWEIFANHAQSNSALQWRMEWGPWDFQTLRLLIHDTFRPWDFQTWRLSDLETFRPGEFQTLRLFQTRRFFQTPRPFQTLRILDPETFSLRDLQSWSPWDIETMSNVSRLHAHSTQLAHHMTTNFGQVCFIKAFLTEETSSIQVS